jgi:hypothetical protein
MSGNLYFKEIKVFLGRKGLEGSNGELGRAKHH